MGTNYYLLVNPCKSCGVPEARLHIGKRSYGWAFALTIYPNKNINSFGDWLPHFYNEANKIVNEYNDLIQIQEMEAIVTTPNSIAENKISKLKEDITHLEQNSAIFDDDYKILRTTRDDYCVGHGDGPYDYFIGGFL